MSSNLNLGEKELFYVTYDTIWHTTFIYFVVHSLSFPKESKCTIVILKAISSYLTDMKRNQTHKPNIYIFFNLHFEVLYFHEIHGHSFLFENNGTQYLKQY